MSRGRAYLWMRTNLNISEEEAHIGMMDKATCQRLMAEVWKHQGKEKK